jgi:mono/diheme cytochrome c family protein
MQFRPAAFLIGLVAAMGFLSAQTPTKIKSVPLTPTSPASGQEMFATYCAVCHGPDGKGNGPATPALKTPPANLARLAASHDGIFPENRVFGILSGKVEITAHGSSEMPMWGTLLRSLSPGDSKMANLRVVNLTSYLKSIQEK